MPNCLRCPAVAYIVGARKGFSSDDEGSKEYGALKFKAREAMAMFTLTRIISRGHGFASHCAKWAQLRALIYCRSPRFFLGSV